MMFKACIDGWLSAASQVVRVWSETDHNQQATAVSIPLYNVIFLST